MKPKTEYIIEIYDTDGDITSARSVSSYADATQFLQIARIQGVVHGYAIFRVEVVRLCEEWTR